MLSSAEKRHRFRGQTIRAALAALLLTLAVSPQAAQRADETRELKELRGLGQNGGSQFAPQPGVSLEQATQKARQATGGRVLSASPRQRSNGTEYRVRLLVDGERVITVTVDSRGRVKKKP